MCNCIATNLPVCIMCACIPSCVVDSDDERYGVEIVKKALVAPCATIARNAGVEPSLVVNKVLGGSEPSYGYDALRDEYVNMFKAGGCAVDTQLVSYT